MRSDLYLFGKALIDAGAYSGDGTELIPAFKATGRLDQAGWHTAATLLAAAGLTATIAELNKADDSAVVMTKGSGVAGMETYKTGVLKTGDLITTRILIDLTGLVASGTDLDIIGDSAAANAHIGRVTALLNGTIDGGLITCLEVPAGGGTDIDFYSATEGTGAQDALATSLTEKALVTAGGAWTSGLSKGMTLLPAADDYLYVANGAGSANGTFSAGKFLIQLFGH